MKTIIKNTSITVEELIAVARQAGVKILEIYDQGHSNAMRKSDDSPLTLADLASHQTIVAGLVKLTPEIPVISEEAAAIPYTERSGWDCFWLVDPLDGTKEFINRNGEFTVNIALVEKGVPIFGVVYAPVLDALYYGSLDTGAFKITVDEGETAIISKCHAMGETIRVVASRSHNDARTKALLERLDDHECISMGSSLKLCLVAEGAAHFYPRLGPTMEWDTAAAHAVVRAAGGTVSDESGRELEYNKPDMHNPEFFVLSQKDNLLVDVIKGFYE